MRLFRGIIPNLAISLNIALLIVIYLDLRNPMMGFLVGAPFLTLVICCVAASVASAVLLYADYRKSNTRKPAHSAQNSGIDP